MRDDHVPDRTEKGIRFGCGFFAGAVLAGLWAVSYADGGVAAVLVLGGILASVFGVLAIRYGDHFWDALARWLRWWGWF